MDSTWLGDLLRLLSVPALVLLNAVFVAGEFALVAVRKTQVEEMVRLGRKGAKQLDSAIRRLDRSIAATQLGITLASIGLGKRRPPHRLASLGFRSGRPRHGFSGGLSAHRRQPSALSGAVPARDNAD